MTVPRATYRVQLNRAFTLHQARRLVPFLHRLGITDLYISPPFQARSGSEHGYDVTDPLRVSGDIGGDERFHELAGELRQRGMGLLVDIVPNHMAASSENRWWTDVLQCGHDSEFADYFDVEWSSTVSGGREKILLPILAKPFGQTLEDRNIRLGIDESGFVIHYFSIKLPVHPSTYRFIAGEGVTAAKASLWDLYNSDAAFRSHLDERLNLINGSDGEPASVDLLEELLGRQTYRLAFWKNARERINYRRFFDVSDLVGVRQERPDVFAATHSRICEWVRGGVVRGLRVDHVDGLLNPREYLARLGAECGPHPYIAVEKILIEDERLPDEWPVDGTTGYDFLGVVNNLFVEGAGLPELQRVYTRVTGLRWTLSDAAYEQKRWIALHLFRGEMNALGLHLELIADTDRHARDLSVQDMRLGLLEVTASLPVYRTYIEDESVTDRDRAQIEAAVTEAQRRKPEVGADVYGFIQRVLLLEFPRNLPVEQRPDWVRFVMRWQQLTGPISAKGVEDTAMYLYNRLISMNEVGGRASEVSVGDFHRFCVHRAARWPATMNATSTHDTKRSEDVRARLNVLSELPGEWGRALMRWSRWNRDKKVLPNAPDPNEEILLYQTMLGAWPLHPEDEPGFIERLKAYVVKAAREAKVYSSWIKPDEEHESAIHGFIDAILDPAVSGRFIQHFRSLQAKLAWYGALNSLSQTLLKITAPGAPDFYQGTELWDFSMVDPDNRRPVDVESRLALCEEMDRWAAQELLESWRDGRIKCFVIAQALRERLDGEYIPIHCADDRVVAFARRKAGRWAMTVAPRFVTKLAGTGRFPVGRRVWRNTELALPEGAPLEWRNAFTGESISSGRLAELLRDFPVGLFVAVE
jgi:(1->4)-alpha-D-glucan 1-alpha-D-glucosylmutase